MRITNNVPALLTHINMRSNDRLMTASMNRLSTGLRINSAREDAAGMAIANKLTFQLVGLERASDNSNHGISLVQTAEGALNEVHAMLQRMRELAVQAANDTSVPEDRLAIQREINDLTDEITALSARSDFNTIKLLNGEASRVATSWVSGLNSADPTRALLTRVLANPLFISEGVPPGTLRYRIVDQATPAAVESQLPVATGWNSAISELPGMSGFTGGNMRINGINIEVRPNHTMDQVWQMLVNSSNYAGVIPTREVTAGATTSTTFTSVRVGSHEKVELSGNASLWQLFGIYIPADEYAHIVTGPPNYPDANILGGLVVPIPNPDFDPDEPIFFDPGDPLHPDTNQPFLNVESEVIGGTVVHTPAIIDDTPLGISGRIAVNGWPIDITPTMSRIDAFNALYAAGNIANLQTNPAHGDTGVAAWEVRIDDVTGEWGIYAGRYVMNSDGDWEFIHNDNLDIVLTADSPLDDNGDPRDLWNEIFGIATTYTGDFPVGEGIPAPSASRTSASSNGTDVRVEVEGLFNGDDPIHDFNRSMSVTTSGNRINVTSAQGHVIQIGVHIPESYRGINMGSPVAAIPPGLLANWASIPPGDVSINGVYIDLEDIITTHYPSQADILNEINTQLAASGAFVTYTGNNWTIASIIPGEPLVLGGDAAIWAAIGLEANANSNGEFIFLDNPNMELRIEEFGGLRIQIGPNHNMHMDIQIPRINAETLGLVEYRAGSMVRLLEYTTHEGAQRAIDITNDAITKISRIRSRLGAYQNRLEHTIRNLDNAALNTETARSRVQDTDMAREMTMLSKRQVMYQAGLAILGQANQRPQMILQLLQ